MTTVAEDGIREKLGVGDVVDEDLFVNLLVYGESGLGKTTLCGSACESDLMYPMLLVDCEGGKATLRQIEKMYPGRIDIKRVKQLSDIQKIHNDIFMHNKGWYKTVALDSLTEIQDVDMRLIMKDTKDNARNPENIDIDVPSPREYGKSRNHIRMIVRAYRDLPMNTIITCLDMEVKEEGKPTRIRPNLPGKLQGEIPGFMDIVGYYYKDKKDPAKRILQLQGTRTVIAKTRFPELGELITNPTLPQIWETIHSGIT